MARRAPRTLLLVAMLAAVVAVATRLRRPGGVLPAAGDDAPSWPPLADVAVAPGPEHSPVRAPGEGQTPPAGPDDSATWVLPEGGACPSGHPVKAKVLSGIYHLPGSAHYARTQPDRCYPDAAAAEADGLRPPKRR
ncbi:MAG TPA: hypothetical protein VE395_08925 [Acidimicrobiales bacterium]|nr:hypothetical protein [Acidimicrobiales bacterium]